ncbi:hypothetical protein BH10ACT6_BH10ACT6_07810 [soil metagenome]
MDYQRLTRRVRAAKQPRGGYLNPRTMEVRYLSGDAPAPLNHKVESVAPSLVGMAVDYLTRYALSPLKDDVGWYRAERAFSISLNGAEMVGRGEFAGGLCEFLNEELEQVGQRPEDSSVDYWLPSLWDRETGEVYENVRVTVPSAAAVAVAVKLASFDVAFRAGVEHYNPDANTETDATTVQHIRTMVARSLAFFREYGPVTQSGFWAGDSDGDFLTADTIWDFKVSINPPTSVHTLQLLALWIMGTKQFQKIKYLGIYNPRLDAVYRFPVASISTEVIAEVSASDVIGL